MLALQFLAPGRLWLLVVPAALVATYLVVQGRRHHYAVRFTNLELLRHVAPRSPGWRRHLSALLLSVALVGLIVSLARPVREERVPRDRATVILAIDTSLSMMADDVPPSRLVAAQRAARTLLDILPARINVGLVGFNGVGTILVPPTTERVRVRSAIDTLELGERTAIGEAIFTSLAAVRMAPTAGGADDVEVPARIVLISDGKTTSGRPDAEGAAAAREAGVPVNTIALGTDDGFIFLPGEELPVEVDVDREALERVADATGGRAYTAVTEDELREVYRNLGSSVGFTIELHEISTWFVGLALVTLVACSGLSLLWTNRLLL